LFFGPDENTANFMDLGAEIAKGRGYRYWKALTTGKSVKLGGVPHDTYGMTTTSVHTYVLELLKELGEQEEKNNQSANRRAGWRFGLQRDFDVQGQDDCCG